MHYILLCNKIPQNCGLKNHNILLLLMILWIDWALLESSSGACGANAITHMGAFSWEARRGLCVHDSFILTSGASLRRLEHLAD